MNEPEAVLVASLLGKLFSWFVVLAREPQRAYLLGKEYLTWSHWEMFYLHVSPSHDIQCLQQSHHDAFLIDVWSVLISIFTLAIEPDCEVRSPNSRITERPGLLRTKLYRGHSSILVDVFASFNLNQDMMTADQKDLRTNFRLSMLHPKCRLDAPSQIKRKQFGSGHKAM